MNKFIGYILLYLGFFVDRALMRTFIGKIVNTYPLYNWLMLKSLDLRVPDWRKDYDGIK